ncbi:UNVERIFIED_CONTAM: protein DETOXIFICATION 24 [Sesamum radiatum]|uniref:Protein DETOXIFICATION 24 n=1 Tax=Sesamum radiatum TaxID=300843 RepID=A0AAW2N8Y2_SESRA
MENEVQERLLTSGTEQEGDLKGRVYEESKKIWRVALPGVISRVTSFGTVVVTQSFLGHISAVDLAGYALVQSLGVRFVNGVLIGMSSATETLCGQAFGAKQYHMMGIFLQRSWLSTFHCLGLLSTFSSGVLLALWRTEYIAWLVVVGEFIYVFGGWCPDSWTGFSLAALKDIPPVVKLSISSGLMVCLELWYYAILVLVAGYMKNAEVAISAFSVCLELWYYAILVLLAGYMKNAEVAISAFSISLNVVAWEFMICLGIMGSAIVRVANELGRGDAKATKFSIKVLMATSVIIGLFFWILCLAFGNKLGYLFTNEEEVAQTVSDLSLLLAFSVLLNGIYPVLSGVAVGAGLQTKVAIINLVCFYIIGLPIGAVLGYVFQLQVKGIWLGMNTGVVAQTLSLSFMVWRTNWDEEVSKTSTRLKKWYLRSKEENNHA